MKIVTCNIRYHAAADGGNGWAHRKGLCARVLATQEPDVISFQEMGHEQFADMSSALPAFDSFGIPDEPGGRRPQNCIFYRRDAFEFVTGGGYWLSETPHVAGSRSWGSACVRLANWVRLCDRATGVELRVVNTHLDHVSQVARENQARLIVEDANAFAPDYPQILTGDMNCDAANAAISMFRAGGWADTYGMVHATVDPGHTYHAFLGPDHGPSTGKMDWIFVRGRLTATGAEVIRDSDGGRFPSDHYFVSATIVAHVVSPRSSALGEESHGR